MAAIDMTAALTNQIVCAVQEIAAAHSIPYVKMLGTTIVAAAGYVTEQSAGVADAALRLADVAIALRERCAALFDAAPMLFGTMPYRNMFP